jgi:feruloyl-CoA synthase
MSGGMRIDFGTMSGTLAKKHSTQSRPPLRPVRLGPADVLVERRADGAILMRSPHPMQPYPEKLTERLAYWAEAEPERIFLAQRDGAGAWRTLTYAATFARVRAIAEALLKRDLSPEKPIAILSGNDIEHALLGLAAMHVGIPYAPISVPYSLVSQDFKKLKTIFDILTPGLVFAANGTAFARAIAATVPANVEVVVATNRTGDRRATAFAELSSVQPTAAVDAAHAKVGPQTIGKILFTSGSTGQPKGVVNTQLMLCANQSMVRGGIPFVRDEPPVLVDWLPWNHTYGSNHNFGLVLDCGGSLYIDEGKPLPGAIETTVRNLRDIAPTVYFNVPKGFEMLLPYLEGDQALRENFFSRLKVMFYAGAGLSQHVHDAMQELAVATTGERIFFLSSLGSTETAPAALACSWESERTGNIGLPLPGVELKLVPGGGKFEARLKGANITPGYWRAPSLTAAAFDEEGFYKIGDALKFADPADPSKGLLFDGRIAEDFKLATGTWVSVGPLRAAFIAHCAPFVRDVVLAGAERGEVAALIIPDVDACRKLAPDLAPDAAAAVLLADARVRNKFARLLEGLSDPSRGSSARIRRAILLAEPPSLDVGEATDKGSINQRAVLAHRAALVEELYTDPAPPNVITAPSLPSSASGSRREPATPAS